MLANVKVLHLINSAAPPDCLAMLAATVQPCDTVACIGAPPPDTPLAMVRVQALLGSAALTALRMRPLVKAADVIHAWSPSLLGAAAILQRTCRRPAALSLPSADTADKRLIKSANEGSVALVVPTNASRDAIAQMGLAGDLAHVAAVAARAAGATLTRAQLRASLGIGDGSFLLVCPHPMVRDAGHDIAAWVHAILHHAGCDVSLMYCQGGPNEKHVRFFARTTGLADRVHFALKQVSPADALAAGDAAIMPARRASGLPALATAMQAGLPIVASDLPDYAELAPPEAALLSTPGVVRLYAAAVLRLVEDRNLAGRLGAAAGRRGEAFTPENARQALRSVYDAILAAAEVPAPAAR